MVQGTGGVGGDPGEVHTTGVHLDERTAHETGASVTVSTQKKSVATRAWAWLAMNSLHDGPVRFGVGSRPASRRIFQTGRRGYVGVRGGVSLRGCVGSPSSGCLLSRRSTNRRRLGGLWVVVRFGAQVVGSSGVKRGRRCQPITVAGLHDQHDLARVLDDRRLATSNGQDRPIRRSELRAVDLSLQHQDLVAKSESFCVVAVAGHQQQSETGDQRPEQV